MIEGATNAIGWISLDRNAKSLDKLVQKVGPTPSRGSDRGPERSFFAVPDFENVDKDDKQIFKESGMNLPSPGQDRVWP